jgi:hypothetical protein
MRVGKNTVGGRTLLQDLTTINHLIFGREFQLLNWVWVELRQQRLGTEGQQVGHGFWVKELCRKLNVNFCAMFCAKIYQI